MEGAHHRSLLCSAHPLCLVPWHHGEGAAWWRLCKQMRAPSLRITDVFNQSGVEAGACCLHGISQGPTSHLASAKMPEADIFILSLKSASLPQPLDWVCVYCVRYACTLACLYKIMPSCAHTHTSTCMKMYAQIYTCACCGECFAGGSSRVVWKQVENLQLLIWEHEHAGHLCINA